MQAPADFDCLNEIPGVQASWNHELGIGHVDASDNAWRTDVMRDLWEAVQDGVADADALGLLPDPPTPWQSKRTLYPHQEAGVRFLLENGGGLLADEMGLGKSTTALVAAQSVLQAQGGDRPLLIVAPSYTRATWRRECLATGVIDSEEDFWSMTGRKGEGANYAAAVWFCHYEIVDDWSMSIYVNERGRPGAVILDEVHWAKNPKTKRGKAAALVAGLAPFTAALTGTPLANRPGELWNALTAVCGSKSFGSRFEFRVRYCGASHNGRAWVDGGVTNVAELRQRLGNVYLRRTKADVAIDLPPLRRDLRILEDVETGVELNADQIRQIYNIFIYGGGGRESLRLLSKLRKDTSAAKMKATADMVAGAVQAGESCVVFTWQRATANRLAKLLVKRGVHDAVVGVVHGGVSDAERQLRLEEAASIAVLEPNVLVATLDSLKEGVTLTWATRVYLHDFSWVPSDMLQAEARLHRISQDSPVVSTWVALDRSMDMLILEAFKHKAQHQADALDWQQMSQVLAEMGLSGADDLQDEGRRILEHWKACK